MNSLNDWLQQMLATGKADSRKSAAKLIGLSESTLNSYLRGDRTPRRGRAIVLERKTRGLGCEVHRQSWDPA